MERPLRYSWIQPDRLAVGARIRIAATEDGKAREIFSTVSSGGSFGASSLRPHIGLGKAGAIDFLEIRWPGSGTVQQFKGPFPADRTYEIREGEPEMKVVEIGVKEAARTSR